MGRTRSSEGSHMGALVPCQRCCVGRWIFGSICSRTLPVYSKTGHSRHTPQCRHVLCTCAASERVNQLNPQPCFCQALSPGDKNHCVSCLNLLAQVKRDRQTGKQADLGEPCTKTCTNYVEGRLPGGTKSQWRWQEEQAFTRRAYTQGRAWYSKEQDLP